MVARMAPVLPSITYSLGGKATPSWSAQPTRNWLPGPCTMLVGMQFLTGKVFATIGPAGFPSRGSISSMVPAVRSPVALPLVTRKWPVLGLKADPPRPARETAPAQFAAGAAWLQNTPVAETTGP